MKLDKGDTIYVVTDADGFRLTPYNPEFEAR